MRVIKLLHKWLGLAVGLQLLMWTISGFMFSWLDHHRVQGEQVRRRPDSALLAASAPLLEPAAWLEEYANAEVRDIRLMPLVDEWVFRVEIGERVELRNATDGKPRAIDLAIIERLARVHYAGDALTPLEILPASASREARGQGLVWQAAFADEGATSFYFSASDGRLVASRNDTWRVFDFFWMLHTMDYRTRDDFNNPLIVLFATGGFWLALSGMLLLSRSFDWSGRGWQFNGS
jgi:Na+-transporting NADH:ubiquinone oxidoreductase subunit F